MNLTISTEEYVFIRDRIRRLCGVEFAENKASLIATRLRQRPDKLGFRDLSEYIQWLRGSSSDHEEWQIIVNCLTTHTTEWFREYDHFRHLMSSFLPKWFERPRSKPLRVWSAACSYGEEPYSVALLLHKIQQEQRLNPFDYEIFGSDIDTSVLAHAKRGMYPADDLKKIPKEFQSGALALGTGQAEGWLKVRQHVRDKVHFKQVNLLGHYDWNMKFDLILCRNVFIYFKTDSIAKASRSLYDSCNPGAYLYIGHSESLSHTSTPWKYERPSIYFKEGKL